MGKAADQDLRVSGEALGWSLDISDRCSAALIAVRLRLTGRACKTPGSYAAAGASGEAV